MKRFSYGLQLFLIIALSIISKGVRAEICSDSNLVSNIKAHELKKGYYVVVGTFNIYENVQRFTKGLCAKGYSCDFAFSEFYNRYYSYLYYSDSIRLVKAKVNEVRKINDFADAWILIVGNHSLEKKIDDTFPRKDSLIDEFTKSNASKKDLSKTHLEYSLFVRTTNDSSKKIFSKIRIVTINKERFIKSIESYTEDAIWLPKDQPQKVKLICESFGYRQRIIEIDLSNPISDSISKVKLNKKQMVIDLKLEPNKKGDIMIMYNVYFFPNTNILRAKSSFELQRLLELLKDNSKYVVMIHGHTNGNSCGEITTLTENCDDFFNPSETILTKGNSYQLSELRAETICLYLIKNGIDPKRLSMKGWGGGKNVV